MLHQILFLLVDLREKSREFLSDLAAVRIHKQQGTSGSSQRSAPTTTHTGKNNGRSINYSTTIRRSPNICSIYLTMDENACFSHAHRLFRNVRTRSPYQRLAMFQELFSFSKFSPAPSPPLTSPPLEHSLATASCGDKTRGYATYLVPRNAFFAQDTNRRRKLSRASEQRNLENG